jgi:hypothetical protein
VSSPTGRGITAQLNTTLNPSDSEVIVDKFNVGAFFEHNADEIDGEIERGDENETRCTFFIAEEKVQECPRITVRIGEEVLAILDTGCELTIMNEHLYEKIKQRGNSYLELPAQHLMLMSAFNDKGKRVKKQIFVPVKLGNVSLDQVFIISQQLITSAILGVDFFLILVLSLISLRDVPFLKYIMK